MSDDRVPNEIIESTPVEIRSLIDEILKIEKEYQHFRELKELKGKDDEISNRIIQLIKTRPRQ